MSRHTKFDEDIEDVISWIVKKCYEISTTTKADAFFSYSPHTSQIDIFIHPNGWSNEDGEEDCFHITVHNNGNHCIYFGDTDDGDNYGVSPLKEALKELDALCKELRGQTDEKDT